jgi:toxin ParE1/3/4
MLPVVWLESAADDLAAIATYIGERNPQAARALSERLLAAADLLGSRPVLYRVGPVAGTRQFVSHPNYSLVYRITVDAVEILNVVHARQRYPN